MSSLVEGYYDLLDGEDLGQFVEVMVYEVLAQTRSNS
jgi:hypothetical protein